MPRWLKIVVLSLVGAIAAAIVAAWLLYRAAHDVPEFYRQAVAIEPGRQRAASNQMSQRATALAGDLQKEGRWQAVFTAEQINGWLTVELEQHPELLPGPIHAPRVAITPQQLTVACRYQDEQIDTVLSLMVDAYLPEPNVVALRVRKARAGSLPLPLDRVLQQVSRATDQLDWQVDWRQAEGDPVALVRIPATRDRKDRQVRVETLRLGDGEIYVAGSTSRR